MSHSLLIRFCDRSSWRLAAKKGGFKDTCPEELLVAVFSAAADRAGIDKKLVEEIQVGNVLPPGGGASVARMAQLAGEWPDFAPKWRGACCSVACG